MLGYGPSAPDPFEPEEEWKAALKLRITKEAESLFDDARATFKARLAESVVDEDSGAVIKEEYMQVMKSLEEIVGEQYETELLQEKVLRRRAYDTVTKPDTARNRAPDITTKMEKSSSEDELLLQNHAARRLSKSSTDSPSKGPHLTSRRRPTNDERNHVPDSSSSRAIRRPSDAQRAADDSRRPRPSSSGVFDEVDGAKPTRSRQPTGEAPPTDRPWDSSLGKSVGSSIRSGSERHSARSPPTTEFRRGSAPPPEDLVPPTKPFTQVNRRGSTASMRSTGSGASIRPMTETIPERIDDVSDEDQSRRDRQGHDKSPRKPGGKVRERRRDSRPTPVDPHLRHEEPLSSAASVRSTGSSSATMQYATSISFDKYVSSKPSSTSMDDRYYTNKPSPHVDLRDSRDVIDDRYHGADRPQKPNPYADPRDAHIPTGYREPYSPRDPPLSASRPTPTRSPYQADDREYPLPPRPLPPRSPYTGDEYSLRDSGHRPNPPRSPYDDLDYLPHPPQRDMHNHPTHPPPPPRTPYNMDERDYSPYPPTNGRHTGPPKSPGFTNDHNYASSPQSSVSPKGSFHHDDPRRREHTQWERERQPAWNDDRDLRDYGRDREREGYSDPRGPAHPQYSRAPAYPSAPPEQVRPQDYHTNGYDDRDPLPPLQGTPRGYNRPDSARPNVPTRQPSYTRRPTPDHRVDNELEPPYLTRQYHSQMDNEYPPPDKPPRSAPIQPPPEEPRPTPAWKDWVSDARLPPPHMRMTDAYASSPPPNDQQFRTTHMQRPSRSHRYRRSPASPSDFESPLQDDTDYDDHSDSEEEDEESHDTSFSRSHSGTDEGEDADEEADDSDVYAHRKMHETSRQIKTQTRELERLAQAEKAAALEAQEKETEMARKAGEAIRKQELYRREEEDRRKEGEAREAEARRRKEQEARDREESERKKEEEILRKKEEETRRKEEELRHKEEEAKRIREEAEEKAEQAKRKEEEAKRLREKVAREEALARKKNEEAERKAAQLKLKEIEANKKESEVSKREQDALKQKAEAQKLQEEARKKAEEAKRKEREVQKKEKETREREEALKREAAKMRELQLRAEQAKEEIRIMMADAQERERLLAIREAEVKEREESVAMESAQREAEIRRLGEESEAKRKEEAVAEEQRREEEAAALRHRQEQEAEAEATAKRREEKQQEAVRISKERGRAKYDEDKRRRDQEDKRKDERSRQAAADSAEESARRKADEQAIPNAEDVITEEHLNDPKFAVQQAFILQQVRYEQKAEAIRLNRRAEQRSRNDSLGSVPGSNVSSSPVNPSSMPRTSSQSSQPPLNPQYHYSGQPAFTPSPTTHFNQSQPSPQYPQYSHGATPAFTAPPFQYSSLPTDRNGHWSSSIKTPSSSSNSRSSTGIPFQSKPSPVPYPSGASPNAQLSEEERGRRQAEFVRQQQEKFRREQEQAEAAEQMRRAGTPLSREETKQMYELHEKLWKRASDPATSELTWNDFPWPMARLPNSPDDITFALVNAYMQSPHWPDREQSKKTKDRIKDQMKKWHPDRFETKFLPRVQEKWKETVKLGAGNVTRHLGDLLRKENEGSLFGD